MGNVSSVKELYSNKQIQDRIVNMAAEMTLNYEDNDEIVVICLLKGGFMFTADLVRLIVRKIYIDFMSVSSYGNELETSGMIDIKQDIRMDIEGKNVILIDDIVDSGLTIKAVVDHLKLKSKEKISLATLYNTVHAFKKKGYLKEISINSDKSYFDTNISDHHHFFNESTNELIDLTDKDFDNIKLKKNLPGKKIKSLEILVKVANNN